MSRWHQFDFPDLPEEAFQPRGGRGKFAGSMTLEGGGKGKAPAPDPQMGAAALQQIALNREIFQDYQTNDRPWMQSIADEVLGISRANAERANALGDYQLENMRFNDQRYRDVGIPFEDELLSGVRRFDSDAFKQQQVDSARADVGMAFDQLGLQAGRNAGRMGIDRVLRTSNDVGLEKAKAMATASNKTRQAAEQIGLSTKMQMYGGMKGLAGLGATNAQLGIASMGAGQGAAAGMMGAGTGFLGANNAAQGAMNTGISSGLQGYGNYVGLQQNAQKINNDADPFAALLGGATTLGAAWIGKSDRRLKADIMFVGTDEATGLSLYEFRYIDGAKRYRGVMADEVEARFPEAVFTMPDGYKAVNYAVLGMQMVEVEGETA